MRPSDARNRPEGKSRGDQPLRRLYQKSRALLVLSAPSDQRQSPPAPIDDAVSELIQAGKIRPESQEVAYGLAREIVVSACKWGDYYEAARRRRFPERDKKRKSFAADAEALALRIERFLQDWDFDSAWYVADPGAPQSDPLSTTSVWRLHGTLTAARNHLRVASEACRAPAPGLRGSPGDPWLIAFVWEMAIGWSELTVLRASKKSGAFENFLRQGLASVDPNWEPNWESAIETVLVRYRRDGRWIARPGDDLDRHPIQGVECDLKIERFPRP